VDKTLEALMGNTAPKPPAVELEYAGLCKDYSTPGQSPLWTDGQFLYAPHRAIFPRRCTMCNKSHKIQMHIVKLRYTPRGAGIVLCVLGGMIGGAIAQLLFSRTITVQLGACTRCNTFALCHNFISTLLAVTAVGLLLISRFNHNPVAGLYGFGALAAALLFFALFPRPVRVLEINDNVARITNVSHAFLESLS
jgi:hypothetical protein